MNDREISAREAFADIRAGMDETALMKKYKLSTAGLKNLIGKLSELGLLETDENGKMKSPRKRINVREFVMDFRSGIADAELMKKYGISSEGLYMLYSRLIDLKALHSDEVFGDPDLRPQAIEPINVRETERFCLDFELAAYVAGHPGNKGIIRDITEKGVGLSGISCSQGAEIVLVISPDKFMNIEPFVFKAKCAWTEHDVSALTALSGFKIDEIADEDLRRLRLLIGYLSFCA